MCFMKNEIKRISKFYYLPGKGNLGDVLIASSTFQYFKNNNIQFEIFDITKEIKDDFNLIYGGGGIWTKDYQKDYQEILNVFKSPYLKSCIILPSSFYNCPDLIEALDERFIVYAREQKSFDYIKQSKASVFLADDMVVGADLEEFNQKLKGKISLKNLFQKSKAYKIYKKVIKKAKKALKKIDNFEVGYLFRTDCESNFENNYNSIDISNFRSIFCTNPALDFILSQVFLGVIDKFDVVVTDRLHIGIAATKLNKKVLLLDNTYGKNLNVYNQSLKDCKNVELINKNEIESKIAEIKEFKSQKFGIYEKLPKNIFEFLKVYSYFENDFNLVERI